MHDRDTWYEYTVTLEVDPTLAGSIDESHVANKAEDELASESELGPAARWFEVATVDGECVTFELRIGTAHEQPVGEDGARAKADEWATEMFERVGAPVSIDPLEYRGLTVPTEDGSVPIEEYQDDDSEDNPEHDKTGVTTDDDRSDAPSDSDGVAATESPPAVETESIRLEHAMGGPS